MIVKETDQRFYVAKSGIPGAGMGLFAKVPLKKNEMLEVVGALVPPHSASDECSRYADAHKFRVGNYLLIPMSYGGLVNHSRSPNMEKVVRGKKIFLRTLRPIKKGEELLYVYSKYAQDRFGLNQ